MIYNLYIKVQYTFLPTEEFLKLRVIPADQLKLQNRALLCELVLSHLASDLACHTCQNS